MAKRMITLMKPDAFNVFDPISIIRVLKNVELTCRNNRVHEGASVWLALFFMNNTAFAELHARHSPKRANKKLIRLTNVRTRTFTASLQVVVFLSKECVTKESLAETELKIMRFAQPSDMTPFQYAKKLVTNTLPCKDEYEKYTLDEITIKGLDVSIHHSMRETWRAKQKVNLHDLAFYATALPRFPEYDDTFQKTWALWKWTQAQRRKPWFYHTSDVDAVQSESRSIPSFLRGGL